MTQPRDSRGRFRKANEDLSRFGWLIGAWIVFEFVVLMFVLSQNGMVIRRLG